MCPNAPIDSDKPATELGLPNPIQDHPRRPPDLSASDGEKEAYERGVKAGLEAEKRVNPYPENGVQAKAYEHGYLDGQKVQLGSEQ